MAPRDPLSMVISAVGRLVAGHPLTCPGCSVCNTIDSLASQGRSALTASANRSVARAKAREKAAGAPAVPATGPTVVVVDANGIVRGHGLTCECGECAARARSVRPVEVRGVVVEVDGKRVPAELVPRRR